MIRVEKKNNGLLHVSKGVIKNDKVKRPMLLNGSSKGVSTKPYTTKSYTTKPYTTKSYTAKPYAPQYGKYDKILYSLTNVKGVTVADDIYLEDVVMYGKKENDFITLYYDGSKTTLYINEKVADNTSQRSISIVQDYNGDMAGKLSKLFNFIGHVNIHMYAFIVEKKKPLSKDMTYSFEFFDMKINGCYVNWNDLMYFSNTYDFPLVKTFGPIQFQSAGFVQSLFESNKDFKSIVVRPVLTRKTGNISYGSSEELRFYQESNPLYKSITREQKILVEQKAREIVEKTLTKDFYNSLIVRSAHHGLSISNVKDHPSVYAMATNMFMTSVEYLKETAKIASTLKDDKNKTAFEKEIKRIVPKNVRENLLK